MVEVVTLGEITCPSGELVLLDGGHLGVWCGDGAPEEIDDPQIPYLIETTLQGVTRTERMIIEKAAVNPHLDDARFAKPT